MAKATLVSTPLYSLTLTEKEAQFVMSVMQNPMCHPDDEPEETRSMRKELFEALKAAGVPN